MFWLLFLELTKGVTSSTGFSDVLAPFIFDATPTLFAPVRLSVHACLNEGKLLSGEKNRRVYYDTNKVRFLNSLAHGALIYLIAYFNQIDQDDTIALSRQLSRNHIIHEIYDSFADFDDKILFDPNDHQSLRILDLQCDYALRILLAANLLGMFVAPSKWLLIEDRRFDAIGSLTSTSVAGDNVLEIFEDLAVYPDSDVVLASRIREDFLALTSIYRPSRYHSVILEDRGNWTNITGLRVGTFEAASRRRSNLQLTPLKAGFVMVDPNTINHLTDYEDKHVDPTTKIGYPLLYHIMDRMNATVTYDITNFWGYEDENGSWSGLTGMLQRREIDITGTNLFMTPERIGVIQYVQLYMHTSGRFIFKQPLLSSVSNILTQPFHRSVWIAIGTVLLLVLILLYLSTKWEYHIGASPETADYWKQFNPSKLSFSDNVLVILGAAAQQGYSYEPYRVPPRIVTLMLLILVLSLYAAYSANIVALLQSTSDSIKTITDLRKSPLTLGVHDIDYVRYYFKNLQDPARKALVEEKIEFEKGPKCSFMTLAEGVERVRTGLFAFHAEAGVAYKLMQNTYQEEEKCGITEIDILNIVDPIMAVPMHSPYLEIITNTALLLRESGLKFRDAYRIYTPKPTCTGGTAFVNIGVNECYFALVSFGYGVSLSIAVLFAEIFWFKWRTSGDSNICGEWKIVLFSS